MRQADKTRCGCEERCVGGKERDKCGGAVNSAARPTAYENSQCLLSMCDTSRQHLLREACQHQHHSQGDYEALCGSEVADTHLVVCVMYCKMLQMKSRAFLSANGLIISTSTLSESSFSTSFLMRRSMKGLRIMCSLESWSENINAHTQIKALPQDQIMSYKRR